MSFNEDYLQAILAEAAKQGVDTSNLEEVAKVMASNEGANVGDFEKPNTQKIGVTIPGCYLLSTNLVGPEGKKKTNYQILIADTFDNVDIDPEYGRKVSKTELELRVEKKRKMTAQEKREHDAKPGSNTQVAYNTSFEDTVTVRSGTIISIKPYEGTVLNAHGMEAESGTWLILNNLRRSERYAEGETTPNFTSWSVGDTNNIVADPQRSAKDLLPCLAKQVNYNKLVNVGNNNPAFGEHNRTVAEAEEIKKWEGDLKTWQKRRGILTHLPPDQRILAERALIVSLQGTEMTPELAGRGEFVIFDKPVWDKQFVHTKKEGKESWRQGDMRMRAVVREGDRRTSVVVHMRIRGDNNELYQSGIADRDTFAALAYYYIPHCDGYAIASMDVMTSHNMNESMKITNNPVNGVYPLEVAYGCWFYHDILCLDLASGIIRGGYEIDYEGAKAGMEAKVGTSDLSEDTDPRVRQLALANNLNKVSKPDVINLMESTQNLETLQNYKFFVVMDRSKDAQTMRELLEDIESFVANPKKAKKPPATVAEAQSRLFRGQKIGKIRGWPPFTGDIQFTIFAVKNTIYEQYLNKQQQQIPPEEYVQRLRLAKEDYELELENMNSKIEDYKKRAAVEDINKFAAENPDLFQESKKTKLDEIEV